MRLPLGHHLAYCTNIHPAETWPETLAALEQYTLAVRARVCPDRPFAIGLRLSDQASRQLSQPPALLHFRRWLDSHDCYVFTINGFPFGQFHGARVKERVYLPDWTSPERLEYTNRLFDLLAQLLPAGVAGSVSTVPGSFKEFITAPEQLAAIRRRLHACVKHIAELAARSGRDLHLGLEPEPLCLLETARETVDFFDRLREEHPGDARLEEFLGVNYDTCHLAVEFEDAAQALALLQSHRVKISKIHLSNALKLRIFPEGRAPVRRPVHRKPCEGGRPCGGGRLRRAVTRSQPANCGLPIDKLAAFADDTYLHQVIIRNASGQLIRHRDLADFLNPQSPSLHHSITPSLQPRINPQCAEARVHFHIPLHTPPAAWFETTSDHLLGVLDALQAGPNLCSHLEMETYTWQVLPPEWRSRSVVDQLAAEYEWTLRELRQRGLA